MRIHKNVIQVGPFYDGIKFQQNKVVKRDQFIM